MRFVAALVAAVACSHLIYAIDPALPASTSRPADCGKLAPRLELRCAWRQLEQARREARAPIDSPPHSRAYWRWREKVARRWIRAARYRISHPPIPHLRLWVCIHNHEGAWNDNTGNGYYGGLQMTSPWGKGDYYVYRADMLTPYQQMQKAETGYRENGYSRAWLEQQWYHPDCYVYA